MKLPSRTTHPVPPRHQHSEPAVLGSGGVGLDLRRDDRMTVLSRQQQRRQLQYPDDLQPLPVMPTASPGGPKQPPPPPLALPDPGEKMSRLNLRHHSYPHFPPPSSPRVQRRIAPSSSSSFDDVGLALARMGKSLTLSVEMLCAVGDAIGDENNDIREDMQVKIDILIWGGGRGRMRD